MPLLIHVLNMQGSKHRIADRNDHFIGKFQELYTIVILLHSEIYLYFSFVTKYNFINYNSNFLFIIIITSK